MAFEKFANDVITNLSSAINNSVTTVAVANGGSFPTTGNFRILIDKELMLVTARSSNSLTVVRGVEGSTAVAHESGARVMFILTPAALEQVLRDYVPLAGNSAELVPQNLLLGSGGLLTASSFSWTNQGSSTATDLSNGNIKIKIPTGTGPNVRVFTRSTPTPPYVITMSLAIQANNDGTSHLGPVFRESSSGELYTFATFGGPSSIRILKYNNPTSFNSNLFGLQNWYIGKRFSWFRLEDDNTDVKFWISTNGIQWIEVASEGRTSFMAGGPDEIGVYGNANSSNIQDSLVITHWSGE